MEIRVLKALKALAILLVVLAITTTATYLFVRETIPPLDSPARSPAEVVAPEFQDAVERSWAELDKLRREDHYPSISIAVYYDGRNVWADATGYADIKTETRANVTTRYPIGSISKPLTSTLVMKLVESGLIDIDRKIGDYAPDLREQFENVTLRQLLSHQAGVRHYKLAWTPPFFTEFGLNKEFSSTEESIRIFVEDPLLFEPDSGFEYTTYGYALIAHVLEEATGVPFLELLDEYVLRPIGLSNTQADVRNPRATNLATTYMAITGDWGIFQPPETNPNHKLGGGGLISTPTELALFGDALLVGGFLSEETYDEMMTPRKTNDGELNRQHYGLGWRIGNLTYPAGTDNIVPLIHHGGTAVGSQCSLVMTPAFKITVAICGNAYTGGSSALRVQAAFIALYFHEAALTQE